MNRKKLEREGAKWVEKRLINQDQLQSILNEYEEKDRSYLLVLLASMLISISVLLYIFSDLAQVPNMLRIIIMTFMMLLFYVIGFYLENRDQKRKQKDMKRQVYGRWEILGISFIIIAYIMFGSTLILILLMYNVVLTSAWPFIVWSILGIILYKIVPNRYLFSIALIITIYGQVYSIVSHSIFNYYLFGIFLFVYFHYVYHRGYTLVYYLFSVGLTLQLIFLTLNTFQNYYWFGFFLLLVFTISLVLPKKQLKNIMFQLTMVTLLFYKMFETLALQDPNVVDGLTYQPSFFILHFILLLILTGFILLFNRRHLMTLLLFLPIFYLPNAHLVILITLFIYSIYWLVLGFQKNSTSSRMFGLFALFITILTTIMQYAWESINKSLFFLFTGIILFIISFLYERNRAKRKGR